MTQPAWHERLVELTNAHPVPRHFVDAPHPYPLVRVRLAWATGDEWVETEAWGWTRELVLVYVKSARVQVNGVWVGREDVRSVVSRG